MSRRPHLVENPSGKKCTRSGIQSYVWDRTLWATRRASLRDGKIIDDTGRLPRKESIRSFFHCAFHFMPRTTAMQLLEAVKYRVCSTHDSIGKDVFQRHTAIIFTGMMNELTVTDKPHREDKLKLQNADVIRELMQDVLSQGIGSSSVQDQTVLGTSTRKRRKIPKETGTATRCRFLTFTQDLDTQRSWQRQSSSTAASKHVKIKHNYTSTRARSPST